MSSTFPDIDFVSYKEEDVVAAMTSSYEAFTGRTVMPGSPENLFIKWLSNIVIILCANINTTGKMNLPRFATGTYLDSLAELFHNLSRLPAAKAVTTIRFYLSAEQESAQLVPAGTRVTTKDGKITFETLEDAYIPAGELSVDAAAECQVEGAAGNGYTAGQITNLVDVFPFYDRCANITTSAGGSDVEDDDSLRERMRESEDSYSTAGPQGGYVYWAKTANSLISDVCANSPVPGEVKVYILLEDGQMPDAEVLASVAATLTEDSVRPLTDHVEVLAPQTVDYDIDFTYYLQSNGGASAESIEAAVEDAVAEYRSWQGSRIGRDVNPSRLVSLLMATGIKRVELRKPVFAKVYDGGKDDSGNVTPAQVASAVSVNITNGGYEDE